MHPWLRDGALTGREAVKARLDEARAEARRLYDEFDGVRKKAIEGGVDLTDAGSAEMKGLEEAHGRYMAVATRAKRLEDELIDAIELEQRGYAGAVAGGVQFGRVDGLAPAS